MSYGARVWGADGALQLDENSFTMRVVLSTLVSVAGGQTYQQFPVAGITPSNGVAIVLPVGSYAENATQYETEVINDAVRVYNYVRGFAGTFVSTAGTMRLLVIRFA